MPLVWVAPQYEKLPSTKRCRLGLRKVDVDPEKVNLALGKVNWDEINRGCRRWSGKVDFDSKSRPEPEKLTVDFVKVALEPEKSALLLKANLVQLFLTFRVLWEGKIAVCYRRKVTVALGLRKVNFDPEESPPSWQKSALLFEISPSNRRKSRFVGES